MSLLRPELREALQTAISERLLLSVDAHRDAFTVNRFGEEVVDREIRRAMVKPLAHALLQSVAIEKREEIDGIRYEARVVAMSLEKFAELMERSFVAGMMRSR